MIAPMKKITVYGINPVRKTVMEELQKSGCVEFAEVDNEKLTSPEVGDSITQFEKYISASETAIAILDEYAPEKTGFLNVRKDISASKFSVESGEMSTVGSATLKIAELVKKKRENSARAGNLNAALSALGQWSALDVAMNFKGTRSAKAGLYTYPGELSEESAKELFEECGTDIYCEIISSNREITCLFLMYSKDFAAAAEEFLREKGFSQSSADVSSRTPHSEMKRIEKQISDIYAENDAIDGQIRDYAGRREDIRLFYDRLVMRRDKYKSLEKVALTEETFIIEGYIPESRCASVKKRLEAKCLCDVEFSDVPADERPVLFKNNAFVKPVENITRSYSMPSPTDIDPNAVMSIFYYLFFGMMFSDAGYGLIMVLVTGYIGFISRAESGTKQFMRMFFYCGLSTMFWGFMYGSFFGDIVPWLKPIWINPVNEPLKLLIFSICIGVLQIVVGLILKFYVDFRAGNRASAVFDTLSWIFILLGAAIGICGYVFGSNALLNAGIITAVIGVLAEILMKNRETKNPLKRIVSGIIGLYDITSYVSDFLSYSRLMALGLATGVIAQVVNIMSKIVGGGFVGTVCFVLIFIFGHAMNFAINVLGAYVHTNRLQYVEFYSKFYEGGGREFAPLGMNTKYYNFMEDEKNE